MANKITTALASFGMSGKVFHSPLLTNHPGFYLKSIVERNKQEVNRFYPEIKSVKSIEDILQDPEIHLIVINTPDHTHYELTQMALEAGKHVVVEKPFTQTVEQGEKLIRLALEKNLILSVFQNRRWDGDFLTIQEIINNKLLGRLVEFESHFDRFRNYIQPGSWKEDAGTGTGTLYNLGSHMIDQALVLFGAPKAVYADLRIQRTNGKVDDSYEVKLYYPDIKVTLKGSYLVKEAGPRYTLHGTHGSYLKYGIDPQEEALKAGINPTISDWGKESKESWGTINTIINKLNYQGTIETLPGNYKAFYDNVYDVLTNKATLAVLPEQSLAGIKIINLAYESSSKTKIIDY